MQSNLVDAYCFSDWVEKHVYQLESGKSIVLSTPKHIPIRIDDEFNRIILLHGLKEFVRVSLDAERLLSPNQVLTHLCSRPQLDGRGSDGAFWANESEFAGRIIMLTGIAESQWPKWNRFLVQYHHAARNSSHGIWASTFLIHLNGDWSHNIGTNDVSLGFVKWDGAYGFLDAFLLAHKALAHRSFDRLSHSLAARTITDIAMWDCDLAYEMAEWELRDLLEPIPHLRALGNRSIRNISLPVGGVSAWSEGLFSIWNGKPTTHSLHCLTTDDEYSVVRRIYLAQAAVLFPFLELVRNSLIEYGDPWTELPIDGWADHRIVDPKELELGHIHYLLSRRTVSIKSSIVRASLVLRDVRNELAHFAPIPYQLYHKMLLVLNECGLAE